MGEPSMGEPSMGETPEGLTRRELLEELAYRVCNLGGRYVSSFTERFSISRLEYAEICSDPEFRELLQKYTYSYIYLPRHLNLVEARLDHAERGDVQARQESFREYIGEGSGSEVLEIERIRMRRTQEKLEAGIGEFLRSSD